MALFRYFLSNPNSVSLAYFALCIYSRIRSHLRTMAPSPQALSELPLPAADYNNLPYVQDVHEVTKTCDAEAARENLLRLISDHGLSDVFSIHLLHKHFDVPEAHVMVYETVSDPSHPTYQVMAPRKPENMPSLRAKYFFVASDGTMKAYEYTADPQPDIVEHVDFCSMLWEEIHRLRMQDIFSVGVRPYFSLSNYTEIEIPHAQATVFVENLDMAGSIETDWANSSQRWDEGLPLSQASTIKGRCRFGHKRHSSISPESMAKDECGNDVLYLDGKCLPAGCGVFNVLTSAMDYVSVV
jgi:hypothetical protein